tara:strand:+ start:540 stop:752 length:213 start_codon:yes stop_codon:yes gene_type:complete
VLDLLPPSLTIIPMVGYQNIRENNTGEHHSLTIIPMVGYQNMQPDHQPDHYSLTIIPMVGYQNRFELTLT